MRRPINRRFFLTIALVCAVLAIGSMSACAPEPSHSGWPPAVKPTSAPLPTPTPPTPPATQATCPVADSVACQTAIETVRSLARGSTAVAMASALATSTTCPQSADGPGPFPVCSNSPGKVAMGYSVARFGSEGAFVTQADFDSFLQTVAHTADSVRPDYAIAAIGCDQSASSTACDRFAVTVNVTLGGSDAGTFVRAFVHSDGAPPALIAAYNWASGTPAVDGGAEALGDLWTGQDMAFAFSRWNIAVR